VRPARERFAFSLPERSRGRGVRGDGSHRAPRRPRARALAPPRAPRNPRPRRAFGLSPPQELSPWNILCTVAPIALAFAALLASLVARPSHARRLCTGSMAKGWGALGVAAVCFASGLDERADPLRAMHGGWHIASSCAFYFFLDSVAPPGKTA
jgi:hypothetical protein